jgi:uncharacterized hydrophobic protein (TIGR00271 family)
MKYFLTNDKMAGVSAKIVEDAKVTPYYYIMVILSCTIATYGLLINSTAVIIGAMLIAPLMNPVIGGALAVSEGNNSFLKTSFKAEIIGVILAVVFSILLTLIIPEKVITDEILARTKPNLLDLIIALASGAAGAYAICYRPESAILPGVAISTALMPPLCVIGIGISYQEFSIVFGAVLLFLANIIAINFSSIMVFNIFGFNQFYSLGKEKKSLFKNHYFSLNAFYSFILLGLISVPLVIFMYQSFQDNSLKNLVRSTIQEELNNIAQKTQIVSLDTSKTEEAYIVNTVLRSTNILTNDDLRQLENILEYKLTMPVRVNADVVLVQSISDDTSLNWYSDLFASLSEQKQVEIIKTESPEQIIEGAVEEKLALFQGAAIENFVLKYEKDVGIYYIDLYISYPETLDDKLEKSLVSVLEDKLKRRVILTIYQNREEESQTELPQQ